MNTILLVGCGNMGSALLKAWQKDFDVTVIDPAAQEKKVYNSPDQLHATFDIIVYAVKPKVFETICNAYQHLVKPQTLIISIMACVSLQKLHTLYPDNIVVRAMPNLPVAVGQGMTCITDPGQHKALVAKLFEKTGDIFFVQSEKQLDDLTVINGCGPGYFFAFCEQLISICSHKFNISSENAEKMIQKVFIGSALLLQNTGLPSATMKNKVATPGGVTEAALLALEPELKSLMEKGIDAALNKIEAIS